MFSSAIPSSRRGEQGVSLIEALIMLAIVAIATALLMPVLGQSVRRTFGMSDAATERLNQSLAEETMRVVFTSASRALDGERSQISGSERQLRLYTEGGVDHPCAETNGVVRFFIRQDARGSTLSCVTADRDRQHSLIFAAGQSLTFSYSVDGVDWASSWPTDRARGDAGDPAFVRLLWRSGATVQGDIFQIGADGPNARDSAIDQPARTFP